jgi:Rieske Fe-S protein
VTDCADDCQLSGRRQFLKEATLAVASVMAALAASPREAVAMPLSLTEALDAAGGELTYPFPNADGVTIDRANEVILVRWKGQVYAFNLSCPHQKTALKWLASDSMFKCPKHKSKYQPDGTFMSGKATRNMDRFRVRRVGKNVVVSVGTLYRSDKQAALWTSARATG